MRLMVMAMGKRRAPQGELWVATQELPHSPGHPFYKRLNALLEEAGFDEFVEKLCQPFYCDDNGRPSIPPGVYFRMLFVGYFEGLTSQRGIAWRCSDSRSLQEFLGYLPTQATPDHSTLTVIRQRLPEEMHEQVFIFVLTIAEAKGLLKGKTTATDSTFLEANAAMKSIERKDSGEDYKAYLKRLAGEAGIEDPSDDELRRFDKKRPNKKVSNEEWQSRTDHDSRIAKMKDGTTHLAYKAEHVVDLDSNLVLAAEVYHADRGDTDTLIDSVAAAQLNLMRSGSETKIKDVVADTGYQSNETLVDCAAASWRTYIPESNRHERRVWHDKPPEQEHAFRGNRRRLRGARSKRLQRRRSEYVERTFAHICETGGGRRSWLHGLVNVTKRHLIQAAAHNLGLLMRKLFGMGTARSLQRPRAVVLALITALIRVYLVPAAQVRPSSSETRHDPVRPIMADAV